jgi:anaerobic ribonucleoside-triphosphate reductase activating protein
LTSEQSVRVARVVPSTRAEGPGERFAVWVQGCTIRCSGCFNPQMWTARGGQDTDVSTLAQQVLAADVEGVTFLGGEPFEQAAGLAALASRLRAEGLSVMTFTGLTFEHLIEAATDDGSIRALLNTTDLLVDGPYMANSPDLIRPWVGSTNQGFRFLTNRYRHLDGSLNDLPDRIEVRVTPDGTATVNGWASVDALDALLDGVAKIPLGRGSVR